MQNGWQHFERAGAEKKKLPVSFDGVRLQKNFELRTISENSLFFPLRALCMRPSPCLARVQGRGEE